MAVIGDVSEAIESSGDDFVSFEDQIGEALFDSPEAEEGAPEETEVEQSEDEEGFEPDSEDAEQEEELDEALDEAEEAPPVEAKRGAQKRIKELVQQRNEVREQMSAMQAQYQQQMQQVQAQMQQQANAQQQALAQQNELLQRQLQMAEAKRQAEVEESLTPMEQLKRDIQRETLAQAQQGWQSQYQQLQGQFEAQQQAQQEAQVQAEKQARYQYYDNQSREVLKTQIFEGYEDTETKDIEAPMQEMLLSYCAAFGLEPKDAAPRFKKLLDAHVNAKLKARSAVSGKKVAASRKVTKSAQPGRKPAGGTAKPSWAELKEQGFEDYLEWQAAQMMRGQ